MLWIHHLLDAQPNLLLHQLHRLPHRLSRLVLPLHNVSSMSVSSVLQLRYLSAKTWKTFSLTHLPAYLLTCRITNSHGWLVYHFTSGHFFQNSQVVNTARNVLSGVSYTLPVNYLTESQCIRRNMRAGSTTWPSVTYKDTTLVKQSSSLLSVSVVVSSYGKQDQTLQTETRTESETEILTSTSRHKIWRWRRIRKRS